MTASQYAATVVYAWPLVPVADDAPQFHVLVTGPDLDLEEVCRERESLQALATALGAMVSNHRVLSNLHISLSDFRPAVDAAEGLAALFTHHLHVAGVEWHGPRDWAVAICGSGGRGPAASSLRLVVDLLRDRSGRVKAAVLEVNGVPQSVLPVSRGVWRRT